MEDRRSVLKSRRLVWVALLALVAALAVVAAGCGGDDDESSGSTDTEATGGSGSCDKSIWVLLPDTASSPRWETDDRPYFEKAFGDAGVDFNVVNAEGDAATQQSQAEQAIADDAGVIVLTSLDTGSGGAIIDQAKEAGIDVIEYDRFNTGSSGGSAYVSFDNVAVGATMADVLTPLIDDLDTQPPAVFMLNGGEEDNNAFLFRDGYKATVDEKVDAGDWSLAGDKFVPGWGANGEGQEIMEQALTDADNKINAVFAANDNLAQQTINALDAAGVDPTTVPISGQDATQAGIQNIVLGKQAMTVYKPIQAEADVAANAALALCAGDDPSSVESDFDFTVTGIKAEDGKPTEETGEGIVPYLALTPTGVTVDNIADTVVADGFRTTEEICSGEAANTDWCQENG
jgi:D-xylose transport system substrate-binding protein